MEQYSLGHQITNSVYYTTRHVIGYLTNLIVIFHGKNTLIQILVTYN